MKMIKNDETKQPRLKWGKVRRGRVKGLEGHGSQGAKEGEEEESYDNVSMLISLSSKKKSRRIFVRQDFLTQLMAQSWLF